MKKLLPIFVIVLIIVGGGAFYGGMKYAQNKSSAADRSVSGRFANLFPEERQQRFGQMGGSGRTGARPSGANFVDGEIISKDDKSVTVKLRDARLPDGQGGSKIIFFSDSTQITKSAAGTSDDLGVGANIMASGQTNQDGSITAQTIRLRPSIANP